MEDGVISAGRVLTVYFSIIIGAMAIGQAAPSITAFSDGKLDQAITIVVRCSVSYATAGAVIARFLLKNTAKSMPCYSCSSSVSVCAARGAAYHMFEVIERASEIDNLSPTGMYRRIHRLFNTSRCWIL